MKSSNRILIVDDVELNRAILSELFHNQYDILEAENGAEAIELLKQYGEYIVVMLLDIVMPVMDGFDVLSEMKKFGWTGYIPVVMITSETSESVMQKGYELGVTDIISKPFAPNIIRQRIHNVIEQYTYKLRLEKLVEQQMDALRIQEKKLHTNSAQMIDILSAVIEFKSAESVEHIHNIRTLTRLLLRRLSKQHREYGISEDLIEIISEAAAMHDIGKIAIPDHILNKPGKLTKEEFEIMKTHSLLGCEMLEKLSNVKCLDYYDYCYEICRHHHERWDGNGYPDGLRGDETPIWAQVVSLADVYDALTSERVYKEAYSVQTAIQIILDGECGVFNPVLIDCFISLVSALTSGVLEEPTKDFLENKDQPKKNGPFMNERVTKDISDRTLHLLELERQKYRIMSELSEEILFEYDYKEDKLVFSEKYQLLTGNEPTIENLHQLFYHREFMPKEDQERLWSALDALTLEHPSCKLELRLNLDRLGLIWYSIYLYAIYDTECEERCIGYMGKLINIEQQKQETLHLREAAESDPLTDIFNRKALHSRIKKLIDSGEMKQGALCFLDIDNFKLINDTYGHSFGDRVLKQVASILCGCVRKQDLVGRVGGDEFVMFFYGLSDLETLKNKLEVIFKNLHGSFGTCDLTGSMGVSLFPEDGNSFERLIERADQALYQSKLLGKNQYKIYEEGIEEPYFESLQSAMDH